MCHLQRLSKILATINFYSCELLGSKYLALLGCLWERSAVLLLVFWCCWFLGKLLAKSFFSNDLKRSLLACFVSCWTACVKVQSADWEMRQAEDKLLIWVWVAEESNWFLYQKYDQCALKDMRSSVLTEIFSVPYENRTRTIKSLLPRFV